MANTAQIETFIREIAPYAQKAYKQVGKIKPSVCIGMACVESAFGTSGIMRKHNAYFGQKCGTGKTATKYWKGNFFTSRTSEEYTVGKHTVITSAFRAYDSMEQSVFNYYELLNTKLYARVLASGSYKTQMAQIKTCGYMTSSTEVNSVITIIEKYKLTRYDNEAPEKPVTPSKEVKKAVNPYREPFCAVKKGAKGVIVKWVQWELQNKGYNIGKFGIDGDFGTSTEKAVKEFQAKNKLVVDGIVGAKTKALLKA